MSDEEIVTIAEFAFTAEAEIARSTLENEGIRCALFDQAQAGYSLGVLIPVRLAVLRSDVDTARAILEREGIWKSDPDGKDQGGH